MVSLYGPTRPEKYAPFARARVCLKAQDFGSERIEAIPVAAVAAAVERQIAIGPVCHRQPAAPPHLRGPLLVPISAGEFIDKITILEIKAERIAEPVRRANVERELATLDAIRTRDLASSPMLDCLTAELSAVNRELWDIEDRLRQCEHDGRFDRHFIALARGVYRCNDRRAALKRRLNELTGSAIVEEKYYDDRRSCTGGPAATVMVDTDVQSDRG